MLNLNICHYIRKIIKGLPATKVPLVMVSTEIVIPFDGRVLRNITPKSKFAIGTHLLIALYIGIFIPFSANKAKIFVNFSVLTFFVATQLQNL